MTTRNWFHVFWFHVFQVLALMSATVPVVSCGDLECAPTFPIDEFSNAAEPYSFHATHRLRSGVRVELHRPWLLKELDAVVTRTLDFVDRLGPTLSNEEVDWNHGYCPTELARSPRCDEYDCLKIRLLRLSKVHISDIDGVTLLLRDEVNVPENVDRPALFLYPDRPARRPAGCQSDGTCVAPLPSGEYLRDANGEPIEGVYGRWGGLVQALINYKLGCLNSPLIDRVQVYLNDLKNL